MVRKMVQIVRTIEVKLKDKSYPIFIEENIITKIARYLRENYHGEKVAIITDYNMERLYAEALNKSIELYGFTTKVISVKPGEESKSMETLQEVYRKLSEFKLTRKDVIITLGGGVIGDLGGFAASTYLRGVEYIQVPSSLLAQVDSSIGGKVAVDLPWGKNLVGSFYHPRAVFIDKELLRTLDKRFLHDGVAEVIKYGFIKDRDIISELMGYRDDDELLQNVEGIIYKCCIIKKLIVETDEKDFGERMLLNFGHTLGHGIEKYFDYKKYTHGEAVAIGMAEITRKSEELNITEKGTFNLLKAVLEKYELPSKAPSMDRKAIHDTMILDKKSSGKSISLIFLKKAGEGFIKEIPIDMIESYI